MDSPFIEASAPGRLDVMGGIADYSGSLVLQMPIRETTTVRMRLLDDYQCILQSRVESGNDLQVSVDYRKFLKNGEVDYDFARQEFKKSNDDAWIAYVLGAALLLQREKEIDFRGAEFMIRSEVPIGKGVSSSASLEVATLKVMGKAFGVFFVGTELPRLAQKIENNIVGAPCGLMDQLSSFFGTPGKLLPIICQPDELQYGIPLPGLVSFFGIDSGIRHSVGGTSYSDVRCAAFMGYSIIARAAGASNADILQGIGTNDFSALPYQGYLCNIPVIEFEQKFRKILPDSILGEEFLANFGQTIDRFTQVRAGARYSVAECTAHPVYENERVHLFRKYLMAFYPSISKDSREILLRKMGSLMYQSHASYTRCGLGSDRTDEIVAETRGKAANGIFGAKITGGGSGGTVCVLASGPEGLDQTSELHRRLADKHKVTTKLFITV